MAFVGAIDQGTSSSRFILFSAETGRKVASHQITSTSSHPKEGWCEQNPTEILTSVLCCIESVVKQCKTSKIDLSLVRAIGISNQRESTVVWDTTTGDPLHPAIIWLDGRTSDLVEELIQKTPTASKDTFRHICGLPLSTYFSAVKLKWLIDNKQNVRDAIQNGTCCFGTIDTWLLWNLTGGKEGGVYATDVTNASRTMLMNLSTLNWDDEMCRFFDVPKSMLPTIKSSSEIYGYTKLGELKGVAISGILGDQQAALVGQKCFEMGEAKSTYGTGNFILYNTGTKPIFSSHGLLTTVGYKFGADSDACYALEGSVAIAGEAVKWLKDNLGLIKTVNEIEELASSVDNNGDVYFVPAFSGLLAPHWQQNARGLIIGITQATTKAHIARAALESCCFQSKEILDAMHAESHIVLNHLLADGGMSANNFLMQLQADMLGIKVMRAQMPELSALGASIAAGQANGIECWNTSLLRERSNVYDEFEPKITKDERKRLFARWSEAVKRSFDWRKSSMF